MPEGIIIQMRRKGSGTGMTYSIREACEKTGLTAHTLRYYEKEGLLQHIRRTKGGLRIYTERDLEVLGLICCLKNTGMPLVDIASFIQLTGKGEHTLRERCAILKEHRQHVIERMEEMQRHLDQVTWKLNFFSEKLKEYEAQTRVPSN